MLTIIISRSDLKLGHVGSKTRLLGQQATQVSDLGPLWPSCHLSVHSSVLPCFTVTSISWSSDFAIYLEDSLMYENDSMG